MKRCSDSSRKQRHHQQPCCVFASTLSNGLDVKYRNIEAIEGIEGIEAIEGIEGIEGIVGIEGIEGIEQWAFDTKNIEVSRYH